MILRITDITLMLTLRWSQSLVLMSLVVTNKRTFQLAGTPAVSGSGGWAGSEEVAVSQSSSTASSLSTLSAARLSSLASYLAPSPPET